jgi:hypothetical protein
VTTCVSQAQLVNSAPEVDLVGGKASAAGMNVNSKCPSADCNLVVPVISARVTTTALGGLERDLADSSLTVKCPVHGRQLKTPENLDVDRAQESRYGLAGNLDVDRLAHSSDLSE